MKNKEESENYPYPGISDKIKNLSFKCFKYKPEYEKIASIANVWNLRFVVIQGENRDVESRLKTLTFRQDFPSKKITRMDNPKDSLFLPFVEEVKIIVLENEKEIKE